MEILKRCYQYDNIELGSLFNYLGICYSRQGETENAIKYFNESITIVSKIYPSHFILRQALSNLAILYFKSR